MACMLIGDSGTVVFERTGIVSDEAATMSSKVTSSPIEGGGTITDHAVLDAIKLNISGVVTTASEYATLEAMWRNRDLLKYRGAEAYDNLLITSLQRTRKNDNVGGYTFKISFTQITVATAVFVDIQGPSMRQQDAGASKSDEADKSARGSVHMGLVAPGTEYASYVAGFLPGGVNLAVAVGRTNPGYVGYSKGGHTQ